MQMPRGIRYSDEFKRDAVARSPSVVTVFKKSQTDWVSLLNRFMNGGLNLRNPSNKLIRMLKLAD